MSTPRAGSEERDPVIALDGPGGVGKSTVGRRLAERLGYFFLSSGWIYRAMAWWLVRRGWQPDAPPEPERLAGLALHVDRQGALHVDGRAVGAAELGAETVSALASRLSTESAVRARANALQRQVVAEMVEGAGYPGVVLEGRDIGTVVFPRARGKVFLTASDEVRARRRWEELRQREPGLRLADVLAALRERDERDRSRAVAPLVAAADALVIDTGERDVAAVVEEILRRLGADRGPAASDVPRGAV